MYGDVEPRITIDWGRADIDRAYDDAAAHDLPWITLIGAVLFATFAVVDSLTHLDTTPAFRFFSSFLPAVGLAIISIMSRRRMFPAPATPWVAMLAGVIAITAPLITVWHAKHTVDLAFCMLIIATVGASVYRYLPYAVFFGAASSAFIVLAFTVTSVESAQDWTAALAIACALGAVLLAARRRSVRDFAEAKAQLRYTAGHDALTGLMNRHGLETAGPTLLALARRDDRPAFAAFVDIDGLSEINNQYGHGAGDEVIGTVADALVHSVREADIVSRWGGDEIVLVGIGEGPDAHRIEDAVRDYAVRHTAVPGWDGQVSVGVTTMPSADATFETLILTADAAMYARRDERRSGVA